MKLFALGVALIALTGCSKTAEVAQTKAGETQQVAATAPDAVPEPPKKVEEPPKVVLPPVVIASGTRVRVRTSSTISTKSSTDGERFTGSLAEPILVDGKIIVPKDAAVEGLVVTADDGGRVKGVASLSLRLTSIEIDGETVPVKTGVFVRNARTTKKKDALKVGIGAGIGAAIGAIAGGGKGAAIGAASGGGAGTGVVLATHGDPAVVAAESIITFRLTSDLATR
jgi:hypothetical protein